MQNKLETLQTKFNLTEAEAKEVSNWASSRVIKMSDDELSPELFEKLQSVYISMNEMPYSMAKALTEDPTAWIARQIASL